MLPWPEIIDLVAGQNGFAGVVSVARGGETEFVKAYGLAHRAHQIPNTVGTRFAIASGSKGLTALTVVSLVNDGALSMSTTARSVLGRDLPLIGGGGHRFPGFGRATRPARAGPPERWGQTEDERFPPAGPGQRGRRDLFHRRGHHRLLAVAVHREDRACRLGGGDGAGP